MRNIRRYVTNLVRGGEDFMGGRTDWQAQQRSRLLEALRRASLPEDVIDAVAAIPREKFMPEALHDRAYEDNALPIAEGQTISQPSLVAMMIAEMRIQPDDRVLDVGTGSGYQAALLSKLAAQVVTVERIPTLAENAGRVLSEMGISNVEVHVVTDDLGWVDGAPYDSIVVAAAAPRVPEALVNQLRVGGRLVIPVGSRSEQTLLVVTRTEDGHESRNAMNVRFVPLISPDAFSK